MVSTSTFGGLLRAASDFVADNAVAAGHREIHDHHVRRESLRHGHGVGSVRRLADHSNVGRNAHDRLEPRANDGMIIGEQDVDDVDHRGDRHVHGVDQHSHLLQCFGGHVVKLAETGPRVLLVRVSRAMAEICITCAASRCAADSCSSWAMRA